MVGESMKNLRIKITNRYLLNDLSFYLLLIFLFSWLFGFLSGFTPSLSKFYIFSITAIFTFLLSSRYINLSRERFYLLLIFLVTCLPGLILTSFIVQSLLYFTIFFIGFIILLNKPSVYFKLDYSIFIFFILSLILAVFVYSSSGKLFFWSIQPSIFDMLMLAVGLRILCYKTYQNRKKSNILIICIILFYGHILDSRLLMLSPFLFLFLNFILVKYFFAIKYSFYIFSLFFFLLSIFLGELIPIQIYLIKSSIPELDALSLGEGKRLSLLLNGWEGLITSNYFGIGFGTENYKSFIPDNLLGITPQLLPLTVALYTGVVGSFIYFFVFVFWVFDSKNSLIVSSRMIFFFFILGHEYVFNPFFWISIIVLTYLEDYK